MTVSKIRELMQERVIPESVLPQNIAAYLNDGDYLPPELDAFTFLNRLRSLGIGSADFLYLLKGCGAPEEAVEKIEQHPDMNLQSLIMTLDGSGLTPKDYTRMLYTARQLWEHTITMRLDLEEAQEEQPQEEPPQPEQPRTARQKKPAQEQENAPEPEEQKPVRSAPIRTARQKKKTEQEFREYVGVKPIGQRDRADEPLPEKETPAETSAKTGSFTAVQLKPHEDSPDEGNAAYDESDNTEENAVSHRGGIITASAGAAVLCALSAVMQVMGFSAPDNGSAQVHYAEDRSEIFAEVGKAYQAGNIGGDKVQPLPDREQVFGDLLISSGDELGVYSSGSTLWAAEHEQITVYSVSGDGAEITAEILPPQGAQFLTVCQTESGIAAVFSGDNSCGIAGIDASGQSYLTEQSGTLTDYYFSGDIIRLGSVYTPEYTRSFGADDVAEYLPLVGWNGSESTLDPSVITLNGKALGISYAVWGEYSAAGGEPSRNAAALGDPVFSGAEHFTAVLRSETGSLLISSGEDNALISTELGQTTAAACGGGILATAEQTENGTAVYLRGEGLQPLGGFSTGSVVSSLFIDGEVLCVWDGEKTVMAADISKPDSPAPVELTAAQGTVSGEFALCGGKTTSGITLTLYKLEDGRAVQTDSYAKTLTAKELESFSFSGRNTMVINGAEQCGAAYRWFDGVSVVDEFAELGKSRSVKTLYDDRSGFTAAAVIDGMLTLICGEKTYN